MPSFLKALSFLLCACALVALPAAPAHAQAHPGGSIQGTVTDESGGVLPGVSVSIRNQKTGVVRETQSDSLGLFRAPLLPVGLYEISASLQGFASLKRGNVELNIGQVLEIDLSLKVAGAEETITVEAETPLIESDRSQQSSTVNERAVSNLPVNGRNFIDFVLTTPGVTRDTRAGDISFAGQRGTLNSVVIDGSDNNNTFFGQSLGRTGSGRAPYQFSQDAVQEFQVNRNAYSAEYGRAGGAVVNVVTKSGTNEFHGSAFEFYRDKDLNANSYANKTTSPVRPKSPYHIDQFGASFGGPIVKSKAFFFLSYDGQRRDIPNDVILTLPGNLPSDPDTQAGLATIRTKDDSYQQTRNQNVFLAKVDWQIDPRHRLSVRYNHQNFTGGNNETGGTTNSIEHTGDSLVKTRTVTASLTSVFSSSLFNELRVQVARDEEPGLANTNDPETVVSQGAAAILTFGRNNFSPRETTIKRFQIADIVTLVRGAHAFKFGADVNVDKILNFFPGFFGGSYRFMSLAQFNRGLPNGSGEFFQQNFAGAGTTGPETHPDIFELAFFAQDEWRLNKQLTLNLGLRWDLQKFNQPEVRNPDPQLAAAGIDTSLIHTDGNNFAPRVGLAWTPDSKTVVRGGYGLFYGRTPSIMVGTAHSNNGINVISVRLTGSQVPRYPTALSAPPTGVSGAVPSIFFFQSDYENPEVHQASAGIERQLGKDFAVSVGYMFVAGRKLQRTRDFNIGTPVATSIPVLGGGSVSIQQFPTARPFTNFARILSFESTAESTYNGLTVEARKRFGNGLQATLAYTLGKVTDTKPDATAVVPGNPGDDAKYVSNPADFEADRAPGDLDQRHRLVFSGIWDIDYFKASSGAVRALLGGWQMSWISTIETGLPYNRRITGTDVNRDQNPSNDIVPGFRNSERLPTQYNTDFRIAKRIPLGPRVRLDLIGEAFNVFNQTNVTAQQSAFYNYNGTALVPQQNLSNPRLNFGTDSAALLLFEPNSRIVQLAAKLTF
jgi:outer membrane receptor for ferrienterochelin and colicin